MGGRLVPRLVVVSNRVAVPDPEGPRQAGGLAVAVNAALKHREGIWFGWSGQISENGAGIEPQVVHRRQRSFVTIDLSSTDFQEYYNGFANRVLWPILHYRVDLQEYSRADQSGYMRVNRRFADSLDGLIIVDLRKTDLRVLERYMGKDGAAQFLQSRDPQSRDR